MTNVVKAHPRYRKELAKSLDYIGLFGLSVGKPDFANPRIMRQYVQFMGENFVYGILLIADFPKKYNIMALTGLSEKTAEEKADIAGGDLRNNLEKVTRDFPTVKVARWKQFMTPEYGHNLEVMRFGYSHYREFREECDALVVDFLHIPENKAKWKDSTRTPLEVAKEYLLDELALLVAAPLKFRLPVCEIYPGRNEVHERVQNREFEFCKDLRLREDRIFMEVYHETSDT